MADSKKRTLRGVYDALTQISQDNNVDFGLQNYANFEQFRQKYKTRGSLSKLHDALSAISDETGLDFGQGTKDEWLNSFTFNHVAPKASKPSTETASAPADSEPSYSAELPSVNDMRQKAMERMRNPIMARPKIEQAFTDNKLRNQKSEDNPDTGFEHYADDNGAYAGSRFVGQEGSLYRRQQEYKQATERPKSEDDIMSYAGEIDRAYEEAYTRDRENNASRFFGTAGYRDMGTSILSPETNDLAAAKAQMDEARTVVDAAKRARGDRNAIAGFFEDAGISFLDNIKDFDTWDFGMKSLDEANRVRMMLDKFDRGEKLTKSEEQLLNAVAMNTAAKMYYGSEQGMGNTVGATTAQMIPFMVQMAISPAGAWGKAASSKVFQKLANYAGKSLMKRLTARGIQGATRVLTDIGAGYVMAGTVGAGRTLADTERRMTGNVDVDPMTFTYNGREKGDDALSAGVKAATSQAIEYQSEMVGEYFKPLLGMVGKSVTRGIMQGSNEALKNFLQAGIATYQRLGKSKTAEFFRQLNGLTHYDGAVAEYLEEVVGNIENATSVGDMNFGTGDNGVFNLKDNVATFLSVAVPGVAQAAMVKTADWGTSAYKAHKDKVGANVFGADVWNIFKEDIDALRIEGSSADELAEKFAQIVNNVKPENEAELKALKGYFDACVIEQAIGLGQQMGDENSHADAVDTVEGATDRGRSLGTEEGLQSEESTKAKMMLEHQRARIAELATDDLITALDVDPVGTLDALRTNGEWTEEERQVAIDYVNARATYDGMIAQVRDDIDSRVRASNDEIDQRVNRETGMVHSAMVKNSDVPMYVVGGNVVMAEDGTIDYERSDNDIIVKNTETGKVEMKPVDEVLSIDTVDADVLRSESEAAIRAEYGQQASDMIDGVLPFNEGDVYNVQDDGGAEHVVAVVPVPEGVVIPDGNVIVAVDGGTPVMMTKQEVQDMSDNAAYERLIVPEIAATEDVQAQPEEENVNASPAYNLNDEVVLHTENGDVRAVVTGEENEDGLIEVQTDSPINGQVINQFSRDELDDMVNNVAPAESAEQTQPEDAMPMIGEGEDAEPDFANATPQRAHRYLYEESGLSEDEANQFIEANKKAADKALRKVNEKQPKMGTSLAKYRKEKEEWQQEVAAAQMMSEYWQLIKDEHGKVMSARLAERAAQQAQLTEQAIADEEARQAAVTKQRQEQEERGANNVAPSIKKKWDAATKVEGARNEIVLANGEKVAGRYMLVESGAATPSHNPRLEFAKNEGFPVDENGQSVNDRDYERDKNAQDTTRQIAGSYDSRALQTPVVVSQDGVVLSGNGRTMAGELAAEQGTDGAYVDYLKQYGQQFGFTPEQIDGMEHPRVVFVPDAPMPYTAETFAKFNAQDMKGQSKTEQAVKLGKVVSDDAFGRIVQRINGFDSLGDFYADAKATADAIRELLNDGAINQMQYAEMFDGDTISSQGKEMLENMLIGKAFESNPDAVRQITAFKSVRQSIITALSEISNNLMLGDGYSLKDELANAIDLVYNARNKGYKAGEAVSMYARQGNLFQFDDGATVADYNNATVMMLADVMNDGRVTRLKKWLAVYNQAAKESANGQMDIFSGGVKSQEDIINDVKQILNYGTEEQQTEGQAAEAEGLQQDGAGSVGNKGNNVASEQISTKDWNGHKVGDKYLLPDGGGSIEVIGFDYTNSGNGGMPEVLVRGYDTNGELMGTQAVPPLAFEESLKEMQKVEAEPRNSAEKAEAVPSYLPVLRKEYDEFKKKYPDNIIMFRTGDAFTFLADDTVAAEKVLGVKIKEDANGERYATIPYESLGDVLPKFIRASYRVATAGNIDYANPVQLESETHQAAVPDVDESRISEGEVMESKGKYGTIYKQYFGVDGDEKAVLKVDEPDKKKIYNGSYFMVGDNRFASFPEAVQYYDQQKREAVSNNGTNYHVGEQFDIVDDNGRILRQGNLHKEMDKPVRVLRFGVEDSLDVTAYQRLKTKGAIADSIMNGKQMMNNAMENRALEEEEDVFGDTVAQLSGSEYAMLKNQAEKDVRKYEAKKKQYESDQMYCHNEIPRLEKEIEGVKERLERERKALEIVEGKPQPTSITVGKQQYATVEAMAEYLKEYNKKAKEVENELRDNPSLQKQERKLTVNVGGIDFVFTLEMSVETRQDQGELFTAIRRKMTYSCEALSLDDVPVHQALLREGLEDIVANVMTGKDFRERIGYGERRLERAEKSLAQVRERDGKPFEFAEELAKSIERYEEYSELMKKELEEKEKKYADMDAEVDEATDVAEAEEEEDAEDSEEETNRYRDGEDSIISLDKFRARDKEVELKNLKGDGLHRENYFYLGGKLSKFFLGIPKDSPLELQYSRCDIMQGEGKKIRTSHDYNDIEVYVPKSMLKGSGDVRTLNLADIRDAVAGEIEKMNRDVEEDGIRYSLRESEPPANTGIGYKVFVLKDGKLYPPMVANPNGDATPVGVWLDADAAPVAGVTKTGRQQVKAGGKGTQGGSGKLAYRPGWHLGEIPYALQFNRINPETGQRELFPANFVWAEVEYADDVDYQEEAMSYGMNASGKFQHSLAGLPRVPKNGAYKYRTNPDPNTDPWVITGAMKVNRLLTPSEVDKIVRDAGRTPQPRQDGAVTDEQINQLNEQFSKRGEAMVEKARAIAEKLGLKVRVVHDINSLTSKNEKEQARMRASKGWYNTRTGEIFLVIPNHADAADVEFTLLHEGVAHYGLRQLFGKDFDTFLDNVYNNVSVEVRREIAAMAAKHGWDFRIATEEYLARLAERADFENLPKRSWWQSVKDFFMDMLRKAGVKLSRPLTDKELLYILWRSYDRLDGQGVFGSAKDYVMRDRLGVSSAPKSSSSSKSQTSDVDKKLFRDGDFTQRDRAIARGSYERMLSSGGYQFREAVQDSMLGLKKAYEAILGNDKIQDVAGNENAYLAENRMSSVNAAEQSAYFREFMQPLLAAIHNLVGSSKGGRMLLTEYMMAKHGLERNKMFADRDAKNAAANGADYDSEYAKNRNRDYSGLTALTGKEELADAEAEAERIVNDFEASYSSNLVQELWDRVKDATGTTLAKIYKSGLMSNESYEQVRDMFEYYIPLRGWDETTSDEVYGYLTSKNGPLGGSIMKHAEGRSSKADDPIATIAMMADAAIRQANRNQMKLRFLNFVMNNPSDLVSVNKLWLQYDDVQDDWIPVFADIEPTDSADDVERKVEAFEERMEQLAQAEPDKYKRGSDAKNIPYKVVMGNMREHQVLVKRNGETYVMTINGNPRAAQALNGLTNPDVEQGGVIGNMLKASEWMNRQLSAFYTTRNPDFVVSNFLRDMLYSNCMAWVKESPAYALRFHKNFGMVNPVVMRRLLGKWESGKLDDSRYIEHMFSLFMLNGGETGYTNVKDIEGHKRTIANELKRRGNGIARAWNILGMQLDMLNRSVENCARFAAFITSREVGRSIERSIYDAKEVSVNFNKKGSGGKMVNATGQTFLGKAGSYISGSGRLFYVFWNAGVQGMTNFGRAVIRHPFKAALGTASMFALGYVIPLLAEMMSGGDGDDDDKDAYYNLPEYTRRSNICFRAGKQWITIPLPIEFRALYGLGELAYGTIMNKEHYSDGELARQMISQVSQILPLDFMEGGGGLHAFIPSAAKPIVEAATNKSWTGLPIYKDTPWNENDPEFTKVYKNADRYIVGVSKFMNEMTGGDDYKKGWSDVVNPAQVEYMLNGYFGGYFKVPNQLAKMAETAIGKRDFEWRNMMIANRVIKGGDERTAYRKLINEYFDYKDEYEQTKRLVKKYENAMDSGAMEYAKRLDFLNNSPEYARYLVFDKYRKDIDDLYKLQRDEPDDEKRKTFESEYYETMRELVEEMHSLEEHR